MTDKTIKLYLHDKNSVTKRVRKTKQNCRIKFCNIIKIQTMKLKMQSNYI